MKQRTGRKRHNGRDSAFWSEKGKVLSLVSPLMEEIIILIREYRTEIWIRDRRRRCSARSLKFFAAAAAVASTVVVGAVYSVTVFC